MGIKPAPVEEIKGARVLAVFGDSITTDHISPAGNIKATAPAGVYLSEHQVSQKDFNSYGSRRGNHEVMERGTFANIRIRNEMMGGAEGGNTVYYPTQDAAGENPPSLHDDPDSNKARQCTVGVIRTTIAGMARASIAIIESTQHLATPDRPPKRSTMDGHLKGDHDMMRLWILILSNPPERCSPPVSAVG